MIEVKSRIQAEAVQSILNNNKNGLLAIATGVGKTKIGIDYLKALVAQSKTKFLWVVPTIKLRDKDLEEEFTKWKTKTIYTKYLTKVCYASVNKIKGKNFDAVILDECQNITINNSVFFDNNTTDSIVALTATPPHEDDKKEILYKQLGLKVIVDIPVNKAVDLGLIAPYKIKVIDILLNSKDKYVDAGNKKKRFKTTELNYYQYLGRTIQKIMFSGKPVPKFMYLNRMRFIQNLRSKQEVAKRLLSKIPNNERVLIFHKIIERAEELCKYSYHSKTDDKDFNRFVKGKINRLAVVDVLNEGVNIPNLDTAVIVQVNSNPRELIQRIGRVLRLRDGHEATIYILQVVNTQDEQWVKKALSGFKNIQYINEKNL